MDRRDRASDGFCNITLGCTQHDTSKKDKFVVLKKIRDEWRLAKPTIVGTTVGIGAMIVGMIVMKEFATELIMNWHAYGLMDKAMRLYGMVPMGMLATAGMLTWKKAGKQLEGFVEKTSLSDNTLRWLRSGKHAAWGAFYIYALDMACSLVNKTPELAQGNSRFIGTIASSAAFWGSLFLVGNSALSIIQEFSNKPVPSRPEIRAIQPKELEGPAPGESVH